MRGQCLVNQRATTRTVTQIQLCRAVRRALTTKEVTMSMSKAAHRDRQPARENEHRRDSDGPTADPAPVTRRSHRLRHGFAAVQLHRARPDEKLTADGSSVTRGPRRVRRALCVMMLAVAVPAAFATTNAAANTDTAPAAATVQAEASDDANIADCVTLLEKNPMSTCEFGSDQDLSGESAVGPVANAFSLDQDLSRESAAARVANAFRITISCTGGGWRFWRWHCTITVTFDATPGGGGGGGRVRPL